MNTFYNVTTHIVGGSLTISGTFLRCKHSIYTREGNALWCLTSLFYLISLRHWNAFWFWT